MDGLERAADEGKCDSALGTGPHCEVASVPPLGRDRGTPGAWGTVRDAACAQDVFTSYKEEPFSDVI